MGCTVLRCTVQQHSPPVTLTPALRGRRPDIVRGRGEIIRNSSTAEQYLMGFDAATSRTTCSTVLLATDHSYRSR